MTPGSTEPPITHPRWELWAIAAVAVLAYGTSLFGEIINWDDWRYITNNPFVHQPSWEGLGRLFTEPYFANYHPLHIASYALDHALFGHQAWGYHLLNVLYFSLGAALAGAFLRRAFPAQRWTLFAALLFAAHPVHVESVAWLSARKDVLGLLFSMIYAVAILRASSEASRRGRVAWYAGGTAAFILALLSKVIVAPLPAAMLAYDLLVRRRTIRSAALTSLPHLALAVVMLIVAYYAQQGAGALRAYPGESIGSGMLTSAAVVARYLGLLVAPINLSAVYDVTHRTTLLDPVVIGSLALLVGLAAAAVWAWRRGAPIPLFCLLWFAITLSPVSGVVPLPHLMADRYLLLPSLAFAIVVAWGASRVVARFPVWRLGLVTVAALYLAAMITTSATRCLVWRDEMTLWVDTVARAPRDPDVHVNLGAALVDAGQMRAAAVSFKRALQLRPGWPTARRNMELVAKRLDRKGDHRGAALVRRLIATEAAVPVE